MKSLHTAQIIASGDLNGDEKTDLITANIGSGTVTVLLSKGDRTFARVDTSSGIAAGWSTIERAIADFNGQIAVLALSLRLRQ